MSDQKRVKDYCPGCRHADVLQIQRPTDYATEIICIYGHVSYQSGSQLMLAKSIDPAKAFNAAATP